MTVEIEDEDLGFDAVVAALEELARFEIRAGVIGDDEVLEYAPSVEARTGFIRDSIDANNDRLGNTAEEFIGQAIDLAIDPIVALQVIGDDAEDIIIEGIEDRDLVSTGAMRDSIIGEVQDVTR